MIICYINGQMAVPVINDDIKITRENPFVSTKDSYTYDITFPLSIPENLKVFGPLNRIDVRKRKQLFNDCALYASNVLVIRGTGTITNINDREVKMQILSGSSSVKYRSSFERIFIDRIPYMEVDAKYHPRQAWTKQMSIQVDVTEEIQTKGYVGDVSKYVFMPVWDETNDEMANRIGNFDNDLETQGNPLTRLGLFYRAVQPNFMMVLHTVLEYMGYHIIENVYDVAPWNQLIIASARETAIIAKALPHWTVMKFLEEFRKLFNATFLFDEDGHTVRIVRATSLNNQPVVVHKPASDFEVSYDEDGLEYLGSSNLDYNLSEAGDEVWKIPQEVLREFQVLEFDDTNGVIEAANSMTEKERLTTLFADDGGFIYFAEDEDGGQPRMKRTGLFTQLTRNSETDDTISLSIVPVCMERKEWEVWHATMGRRQHYGQKRDCYVPVLVNPEYYENIREDTGDEEERDYVTVQDVIEAGMSSKAEETEEDTRIELMWVCARAEFAKFYYDEDQRVKGYYYMPLCYTDWRLGDGYSVSMGYHSLALTHAVISRIREQCHYIGQFHEEDIRVNANATIDSQHEHIIKFLSDSQPDPAKIYNFNGKLFLCAKLEEKVTAEAIDQLKTGYFYEMTL